MISEKNIRAVEELQKIMTLYGKEIAESFARFQKLNNELAYSIKPIHDAMAQCGSGITKSFEAYRKVSDDLSRALKPLYDNMNNFQKSVEWLNKIDTFSPAVAITRLKQLQDNISTVPYISNKPISINPNLLIPRIDQDSNLKKLVKEAILEIEEESYRQQKKKADELAKKRKIEGFGHGRAKK